jgi:hypothetical protein
MFIKQVATLVITSTLNSTSVHDVESFSIDKDHVVFIYGFRVSDIGQIGQSKLFTHKALYYWYTFICIFFNEKSHHWDSR